MELGRHISPDSSLNLIVEQFDDDIIVSFGDYPWHTHADLLVPYFGATQEEGLRGFIDEIMCDRLPIVVSTQDGTVVDIEVELSEADIAPVGPHGEKRLIRRWTRALG
ncbi:MAG: hypothetical protein AB2L09_08370 [Coriobacteriia bacterium]